MSNQAVSVDPSTTILEAAESVGLALPFECRAGVCGQCKTQLVAGEVSMESDEALSHPEVMDGWILACQACPRSDVVVKF